MSSKDASQKMQFFGQIKNLASLIAWRQNAKYRQNWTKQFATRPKYLASAILLQILSFYEQG